MSEDIKNAISDLGQTFSEFKKVNDERLEQIEKGESTAYNEEKLTKLEAKMDSYEEMNQKLTIAAANAEDKSRSKFQKLRQWSHDQTQALNLSKLTSTSTLLIVYCRKGLEGLDPVEKKALTVSNDSTGGYLAPPEYVRELLKTITEISPIRSIARVRSTGARSIQVPKRDGQFAAQWVSESGTRSETTGYTVGLEEIPAHEMYALVDISEQDLEDTVFDLRSRNAVRVCRAICKS